MALERKKETAMRLEELFGVRGIAYRRSGSNTMICCPFCVERGETVDERFRLGIHANGNEAQCFNCGWAARHYALAKVLKRLNISSEFVTAALPQEKKEEEVVRLPPDFQLLGEPISKGDVLVRQARNYALSRGVTLRQIRENNIGVSLTGRYGYRVIFPIWYRKKLLGFTARDFTGRQQPKYLLCGPKTLYNPRRAEKGFTALHLTEGVIKALILERSIGERATAIFGNTLTEAQAKFLRRLGYEVLVLWPDPDPPGYRGTLRTADILQRMEGPKVEVVATLKSPLDNETTSTIKSCSQTRMAFDWAMAQRLRLRG